MTQRFWISLVALVLMLIYTAMIDAMGAHVEGFSLPPFWQFMLLTLNPVILLAAHAMPSVFEMLPGASGNIPVPEPPKP